MTYIDQTKSEHANLATSSTSQYCHGKRIMNVLSIATSKLSLAHDTKRMALRAGSIIVALQLSVAGITGQASADISTDQMQYDVQEQILAEFQDAIDSAKSNMMSDPAKALEYARRAQDLTEHFGSSDYRPESMATSLWLRSEALMRLNRVAEVRPLLDQALDLVRKTGTETKLFGDLHLALARASRQTGDVEIALKSLHRAHETFASLGEARSQAMVLQGLGSIYSDARSFERALEYYDRASQAYPADLSLELSAANNSANILKSIGSYSDAEAKFTRALEIAKEMESTILQGRILTNIASVQVRAGDLDAAEASADKALQFLHGSGGADWSRFVWGIRAEIDLARDENSRALEYVATAFEGRDLHSTTTPWRDIHEIAYRVYQANGLYVQSLNHLEAFKRLDDKGREVTATASLAVANAEFDFTSQEQRFEQLKQEQLRRDAEFIEMQETQRLMTLLIVFAGGVIVMFLGYRLSVRKHSNIAPSV